MTIPPDQWSIGTTEHVRVTHDATGRSAEAPSEDEAFGKLFRDLMLSGDITIGPGRPRRLDDDVARIAGATVGASEIREMRFGNFPELSRPVPVLFLPEPMATEGHQQIRTLTGDWSTVFLGLEAKAEEVFTSGNGVTTAVGATVLFRLTPADPFADKAAQRGR